MRRDVVGVTVRRKESYTELLLHRNEELRKVGFYFFCLFPDLNHHTVRKFEVLLVSKVLLYMHILSE